MIDILLAGVGGQGTVLAAKVLAQAAQNKGWQVRTAETIGMAQRGGNVTSHVRMGSNGEAVYSPLITPGTADMVIALEPGEAARALPYLAPGGVLLYETFASGNETVGKPSRADFLLQPGELLRTCASLRVVAYEDGYLDTPKRFVQRIAAVRDNPATGAPARHFLHPASS